MPVRKKMGNRQQAAGLSAGPPHWPTDSRVASSELASPNYLACGMEVVALKLCSRAKYPQK